MRNSILRNPNAVRSKNVALKRCTVVHKAHYVSLLYVIRVNHFRVHNLEESRDILTNPISESRAFWRRYHSAANGTRAKIAEESISRKHVHHFGAKTEHVLHMKSTKRNEKDVMHDIARHWSYCIRRKPVEIPIFTFTIFDYIKLIHIEEKIEPWILINVYNTLPDAAAMFSSQSGS